MAASDARPVPRKNAAWRVYFAIRKSDGTLITSWTGADSEVSKDGGAFADCTDEATEVGTSGCGYLDLSATEMNADAVTIKITVTNTGALPLVMTVFPEEAGDYRVDSSNSSVGSVSGAVGSVTGAVGSVTGNVGGNVNGNVSGNVSGSVGSVTGAVGSVTGSVGSVVGNVGGSVASVAGAVGSVTGNVGGDVAGKVLGGGSGTISGDGVRAASVTGAVGSVTGSVGSVVGGATEANQTTILARLGAWTGTGVNTILGAFKALLSKTASAPSDIGGTFDPAADSTEAIRDRGDAAWVTGGGGGSGDAEQATLLEVQEAVDSIAVALAGSAPVEPTGRIAQGGTITAYIGDDFRVRSGTELELPITDVGGALYTKLNTIGAANLNFSASRPGKGPGEITGAVAILSQTSATLFKIVVEIVNCGSGLLPDDYVYQIEQRQTHSSDVDSFVEIEGTLTLKAKS